MAAAMIGHTITLDRDEDRHATTFGCYYWTERLHGRIMKYTYVGRDYYPALMWAQAAARTYGATIVDFIGPRRART